MRKILTFLGTGRYEESTIHIDELEFRERVFPLALIRYYKMQKPDEELSVFFFLTSEARDNKNWVEYTLPSLEAEQVRYEALEIPKDIETLDKTLGLIKEMIGVLSEGDEVVLDVTHCFRDIPLTASVVALYLKEVLDVKITILYGRFDSVKNETHCTDLTFVTQLVEWIYAARVFKEYGYSNELGALADQRNRRIYKTANLSKKPKYLASMRLPLQYLTDALRLGSIRSIRESVRRFLVTFEKESTLNQEIHEYVPELELLMPSIIQRYKMVDTGASSFVLDEREIATERELMKFYLDTRDIGMALRLAREYMINILLYKEGLANFVFDRDKREEISRFLGETDSLRKARNHIAHFGFNDSNNLTDVNTIEQHLRKLIDTDIDELYNEMMKNKQDLEASSYAVVSSLGLTEGALYTILNHYNPNLLIVVTSKEGAKILPNILEKTQFKGECHVVNVEDPYTGKEEIARVSKEVTGYLENTRKVVINLTGGTTLLNYMLLKVGDEARHGKTIKTVLAVDKRSYEEQKVNPYADGEVVELD
ncbi:MAG TPA: TM1812 family CRISPR-associated protein [Fervidobacterium sp.]|nr:TM1812 family CRISPR-associated protein [Fervidobacterium sp.]